MLGSVKLSGGTGGGREGLVGPHIWPNTAPVCSVKPALAWLVMAAIKSSVGASSVRLSARKRLSAESVGRTSRGQTKAPDSALAICGMQQEGVDCRADREMDKQVQTSAYLLESRIGENSGNCRHGRGSLAVG